jgi:hypothetical protein
MELRQAQFRNMHSKCRCSCVLQFTRHHRVSSVLHRPQSQMIHCIVLCLDSQTKSQSTSYEAGKSTNGYTSLQGGDHKLKARRGLFKPLIIPSRTSYSCESRSTGYGTSTSSRQGLDKRHTIYCPARDVTGLSRQAEAPRTIAFRQLSRGFNQFIQQKLD